MTRPGMLSALALAAGAMLSANTPVTAQSLSDQNWLPWLGCWRAPDALATEQLCIVPDGAGVRLVTLDAGKVLGESKIVTDGRSHAVKQEGCSGVEQAYWSADGQRVFLTSDLTCEGGATRKVSGIFAFTGASEWISAQSVAIDDQTAARSVRYLAVEPANLPVSIASLVRNTRAPRAAREAMRAAVDADDITEAVNSVDAAAVEEWLTATGQPFQLADDLAPETRGATMTSALDLVSRGSYYDNAQPTREVVHVIERPTYVHTTTYVNTVYRSCWDPWFGGYVSVGRGVHVGLDYGYYGSCGRSYYSRYSPWGYDLWGWRHVSRPIIVIRNNTPIIHRPPVNRDWGSTRNRGNTNRGSINRGTTATPRTVTTNSGSAGNNDTRVTRSGYTNGTRQPAAPTSTGAGSRQPVQWATPSNAGITVRPQPQNSGYTTRAQATGSGYTRTAQPTSPTTRPAPTRSESSNGVAVPRSSGGSRPSPVQRSSSPSMSSPSPRPAAQMGQSRPAPTQTQTGTPARAKARGGN